MKRNKKKTAGIMERCAGELMGRMSVMEIHSNYELIVTGCIGIVDYNDCSVMIETISGRIKISGRCLCINIFRGDLMSVNGMILSVSFGEDLC